MCDLSKDAGEVFVLIIGSYGSESFQCLNLVILLCVTYGYIRMDGGLYWLVLLIASLGGFYGRLFEEIIKQVTNIPDDCPKNVVTPAGWQYVYILSILAEPGFICLEYSIVVLNYLKLKVFVSEKRERTYMKLAVFLDGLVFVGCRFYIGAKRYQDSSVESDAIWRAHFSAFIWLFICLCSSSIAIVVVCYNKKREEAFQNSGVLSIIMKSNLFTLISCNFVGAFLAITAFAIPYSWVFRNLVYPLNALKSAFPLFLAFDAIIIKALNRNYQKSSHNKKIVTKGSGHRATQLTCDPSNINNLSRVSSTSKNDRFLTLDKTYNEMALSSNELVIDILCSHKDTNIDVTNKDNFVYDGSSDKE
eukprot:Awhi_evm1s5132